MFRTACLIALLSAGQCWADRVSFGIKGGFRGSEDFIYSAESDSKRYAVGPMIEVSLSRVFSLEANALYRRSGFRAQTGGYWGAFVDNYRANTWEFPILLKYRLPVRLANLYAEAGYTPRHTVGTHRHTGYRTTNVLTGERTPEDWKIAWTPDLSQGLTVGGGTELGGGRLRVAPELRYTRWNNRLIDIQGSHGYRLGSQLNQLDLLIGITWR